MFRQFIKTLGVFALYSELAHASCIDLTGQFSAEGQPLPTRAPPAYPQFNWIDRMFGKELIKGKEGTTATIRSSSSTSLSIEFLFTGGASIGRIEFTPTNAEIACSEEGYYVHTFDIGMGDGFEGTADRYVTAKLDTKGNLVLDVRVESTSRFLFIPIRNATQFYKARFDRLR